MAKDYHLPQKQATIFPKSEAKGRGASSPQKHILFIQGSPNQIGSLEKMTQKERPKGRSP